MLMVLFMDHYIPLWPTAGLRFINALMYVHSERVLNTHVRRSKHINFTLVSSGIRTCIKAIGLE
jgi:hypothetical protein